MSNRKSQSDRSIVIRGFKSYRRQEQLKHAMCWMNLKRTTDGTAVEQVMQAAAKHETTSGGHAWGFAAITDDGTFFHQRGNGTVPQDYDWPYANTAIGHTRFATTGVHMIDNAHPFPIKRDGKTLAYMCHNGTWLQAPSHEWKSDTKLMAELMEFYAQYEDLETAIIRTAERCGETMLVLGRETAYVYSGRYEITCDESKNVAASSGYTPIPTGELVKPLEDNALTTNIEQLPLSYHYE